MKKKNLRFIFCFFIVFTFLFILNINTVKAEELDGKQYKNKDVYYYLDGELLTGKFTDIFGKTFYADKEGKLLSTFQKIGSKTYFFNPDDYEMHYGYTVVDGVAYYFHDETGELITGLYTNDQGKTYYANEDGVLQSHFQEIGGNTYFFGRLNHELRHGYVLVDSVPYYFHDDTGEVVIDLYTNNQGKTYYANQNGVLQSHFQEIKGKVYFFGRLNHELRYGYVVVDGTPYYFHDETGEMISGLYTNDQGKTYYANADGVLQSHFQEVEGKRYFFGRLNHELRYGYVLVDGIPYYFSDETGEVVTGLYTNDQGKTYYANKDGVLQSHFQMVEGQRYFFGRLNHELRYGYVLVDGVGYYFDDEQGHVLTGLFTNDLGKTYYAGEDGILKTHFQVIDGKTYFFSRINHEKRYGWTMIDGSKYYFDPVEGYMYTGSHTIDGVAYEFLSNGKAKSGWMNDNSKTYYYYSNGTRATGWVVIEGEKCFFNALYELVGRNVKKVIDVSAWQGYIDWDLVKQSDVDGVILRVSAGAEKEDARLSEYITNLKRLGIPYGIYIYSYAENYSEGVYYANFVNGIIKKYDMNPTLGIYLDLESNSITNYMGVYQYEQVVRGFMSVLPQAKVYTYTNYANTSLNSSYIRSYITWIAQYNHYTTYTGNYNAWQYTSSGNVSGISGNVDVSVWFT